MHGKRSNWNLQTMSTSGILSDSLERTARPDSLRTAELVAQLKSGKLTKQELLKKVDELRTTSTVSSLRFYFAFAFIFE